MAKHGNTWQYMATHDYTWLSVAITLLKVHATFFGSRRPISRGKKLKKYGKQPMSRKIYEGKIETLIEICKRKRK